jgi:hypothetical protein
VRTGPGQEYREIDRLLPGATVEQQETDPKGTPWVYVTPPGGWCHGGYLDDDSPGWRTAGSLRQLLLQVNRLYPARDKTHDGTIGDRAHAARTSDHNPNAAGVVTAIDITHDPAHGCDCSKLADALVRSRDPRIKYIIWRGRQISSRVQPWAWRPYKGANDHSKHLHLSVDGDLRLYDSITPWAIP